MKCETPFVLYGKALPCQKCLPCLASRARVWSHRIILEAAQYEDNTFATLTYSDDRLPRTHADLPTLAPEHLRNFLKRLRKSIAQHPLLAVSDDLERMVPRRIRYFAVGEYGDETQRPHYHAAIFNMPTCHRGRTLRHPGRQRAMWKDCCLICNMVGENWGHGDIDLGILETASAQYVAGYVTKKLTSRSDPRLKGREPEFARMSNRPGIAHSALHEIASQILNFNLDQSQGDVPVTLRHGSRQLPLGRYLRRKLRTMIGKDEKTPQQILDQIEEELFSVRQTAFDASESFADHLKASNAQAVKNFYAKRSLFNKGNRHL